MLAVSETVGKKLTPSDLARGQVVANVPGPVIGGAATVMFAMVTAVGIQTLHKASFDGNHNLLIVAVALSVGLIPAIQPKLLPALPAKLPGHLRVQHHLDGHRGLRPQPGVQPLEAVPARARGGARDRPGVRRRGGPGPRLRLGGQPRPGGQHLRRAIRLAE